jgi:hypothetical protein
MSEPKRNWLTAEEFRAECAQQREAGIVRRQMPQPAFPPKPVRIYQFKPNLKYRRRSKLDSSDYAGQVVYRGSTIEDGGPEAERGEAAPAPALIHQNRNNGIEFNLPVLRDEFLAEQEKIRIDVVMRDNMP